MSPRSTRARLLDGPPRACGVVLLAIAVVGPSLATARWVDAAGDPRLSAAPARGLHDLLALAASHDARAADLALAAKERFEAIDAGDALRAELLAGFPDDHRAATWLADRAGTALGRLARDSADLSVLTGMPSSAERRQVQAGAMQAITLLEQADAALARGIETLEARIIDHARGAVPAGTDPIEPALARLVEIEQSQRVPLLKGLSRALLTSATLSETERSAHAAAALRSLDACAPTTPAIAAARDALVGLTLVNTGLSSERSRGAAETRLRQALAAPGAEPATTLRARLGLLAGGFVGKDEPTRGPTTTPATNHSGDDWPDRLLAAEARLRGSLGGLSAAGTPRIPLSRGLAAEMLALADVEVMGKTPVEREAAEALREARRALVYTKLGSAIDPRTPSASLVPELALARALALTRSRDPAGRMQLKAIADRADASLLLRADALWELGVAMESAGEDPRAVLARIVHELPASSRALPAARQLVARRPAGERLNVDARAALGVLIDRDEPHVRDRWRLTLLRADVLDAASLSSAHVDHLVSLIEAMGPQSAERAQARVDFAQQVSTIISASPRWSDAEQLTVLNRVRQTLDPDAPEHASITLSLARVELRQALSSSSEAEGRAKAQSVLDRLQKLVDAERFGVGSTEGDEVHLTLGRAHRFLGRDQAAFSSLRRVAQHYEVVPAPAAGSAERPTAFWAAWCEMLEVLVAREPGGGRAEEIRSQLSRLRTLDPSSGGDAFRSRLAAVANRLNALPRATADIPGSSPSPIP
jgi:hypothetical protein